MIISENVQGTDGWMKDRVGIPTASNFDKIITTKGVASASAKKYMYQLAGERIIGRKEDTYQNAAMQRGTELEPKARELYEVVTGETVEEVGLCWLDSTKRVGASPDGLVGEDGDIEIKCPLLPTQVEYLLNKVVPTTYFQQIQGQLYVTGRKWCDFVSYYPDMPLLKIRVFRNEVFISALSRQLDLFCAELDMIEAKLRG